jgi:hypothetical protein
MSDMRARLWAALPAVLLAIVASTQIVLTRTTLLSPWKGGGFGMFSTLDGRPFRYARMFVSAAERSEELAVPPSLEELVAQAEMLPGDAQFDRLSRAIVARERRHGRPVEQVRIEVWRVEFAQGSLMPRERLLRRHEARAVR